MRKRKTLQELTIKDSFLFAAVMMEPENCRRVLECTLDMSIERVEVSYEKSIVYHPEYKGIRLDVYAKDERNTHFNVEMQVVKREIFKRSRYYHSQMDMELMLSGEEYELLPDCYVIFICDFDPVGLEKYRYTMRRTLAEDITYDYEDGIHTIFLSTKGENEGEVPAQLVKFLQFVSANLPESTADFGDELVSRLQKTIADIKADREMGAHYMLFEEMMRDEFSAGKAEGKVEGIAEGKAESILDLLSEYGPVPEELKSRIRAVSDENILKELLLCAARAESVEAFETEIKHLCE